MSMGTNEKFFKKITSLRKLKKEAKRMLKEYCELNDVRLDKKWHKISKENLYLWIILRTKVNREYSGKMIDNG